MFILLISPKGVYATTRLIEEANKANIPLEVLSMEELLKQDFVVDVEKYRSLYVRSPFVNGRPDYFLQIIELAKKFESAGKKVVDANIVKGRLGEGKWINYERLMQGGLPIPETIKNFDPNAYKYPYILKWQFGMRGVGTFLIESEADIKKIPTHIPREELMLQRFVAAEYEYKIITVGYKSLPVILRFGMHPETYRPDFEKAKEMNIQTDPSLKNIVSLAEKASKILGRELSKVDILQKGSNLYILEVNRCPGLDSFEELTGYNVAAEFLKYMAK